MYQAAFILIYLKMMRVRARARARARARVRVRVRVTRVLYIFRYSCRVGATVPREAVTWLPLYAYLTDKISIDWPMGLGYTAVNNVTKHADQKSGLYLEQLRHERVLKDNWEKDEFIR